MVSQSTSDAEDLSTRGNPWEELQLRYGAASHITVRHYPAPDARQAVIMVGGVGGGWDTPARDLYPRLCEALQESGIAALRVRFRDPRSIDECTLDVRCAVRWLAKSGVRDIGLIGHSFGGAVVIRAAALEDEVHSVVTLSTQAFGADSVAALGPRCPILLIHGGADEILPPACSRFVFDMAQEPRKLLLYANAGHTLTEAADQVYREVRSWTVEKLAEAK